VRRKRRTGRARIVGTLVSVAVIGAVFAFALPRIADYGEVWDEIRKLSWQWLVVLGLATLLNLATYGPPQPQCDLASPIRTNGSADKPCVKAGVDSWQPAPEAGAKVCGYFTTPSSRLPPPSNPD
jgi:hypothetical protein